jgi:anti-sigma B factor antagonist
LPDGDIWVDVTYADGPALMTVRGEIDSASTAVLESALDEVEADERVVLDLSEVEFIDSSGLAVLLRQSMRRRDAGGALHVRRPSEPVRRLLEFCCLEHLLEPETYPPASSD